MVTMASGGWCMASRGRPGTSTEGAGEPLLCLKAPADCGSRNSACQKEGPGPRSGQQASVTLGPGREHTARRSLQKALLPSLLKVWGLEP